MQHYRLIVPGVALALTLAATSLPGRAQQSPTPVAATFDSLYFRSIGPATMSGRIADIAVYEKNPALFYVATAHGGIWKTTNNGVTWEAQLQDQGLLDRLLAEDGTLEKLTADGGTLDQLVALGATLEAIAPKLAELGVVIPELHASVNTLSDAVGPLSELAGRLPRARRRAALEA